MSKNILLIEDNDHRRVTVLKYLLRSGFQVTPCSSTAEAEEVLQFVSHKDMAPAVVVMAAHLIDEGGECFRRSLADRFAGLNGFSFPSTAISFGWPKGSGTQMKTPTVPV